MSTDITAVVIGSLTSITTAFITAYFGGKSEDSQPDQTTFEPEAQGGEGDRSPLVAQSSPKSKKRITKLVFFSILGVGLAITALVATFFGKLPGPQGPRGESVPVGSIIAYWGTVKIIPAGYELCDGERVTTKESPILGTRKPDLQDTFIKGAEKGADDVRDHPQYGGSNFKNLNHTHSAGTLRALIGSHGPSYCFSFVTKGGPFATQREVDASAFAKPGGKPDTGVAVDGSTSDIEQPEFKHFDIRPSYLSLFYIIRVE